MGRTRFLCSLVDCNERTNFTSLFNTRILKGFLEFLYFLCHFKHILIVPWMSSYLRVANETTNGILGIIIVTLAKDEK